MEMPWPQLLWLVPSTLVAGCFTSEMSRVACYARDWFMSVAINGLPASILEGDDWIFSGFLATSGTHPVDADFISSWFIAY